MSYHNNQVTKALNDSYHEKNQKDALTVAVTAKFSNEAGTLGVEKLITALKSAGHADHADAVAAFAELLG